MRSLFGKKEPITDTHELLRQIERKDAAFRVTQFAFFVVALAFLGALLVSNYRLQSENTGLLQQQKKTLETLANSSDQRTKQLNDLQQHIDCVVSLFTQPNRANLTITNIQDCELSASSSGGATGSTKSGLSSGQTQTNTPKQAPAPSNNTGSTSTPPSQSTPGPLKKFICTITLRLFCLK